MTTKMHLIMRHITDHFFDDSCIRRGATDDNDTIHKFTKKACGSTNKHLMSIVSQILKDRVHIENDSEQQGVHSDSETYSTAFDSKSNN